MQQQGTKTETTKAQQTYENYFIISYSYSKPSFMQTADNYCFVYHLTFSTEITQQ
jgi:hypothetical protein